MSWFSHAPVLRPVQSESEAFWYLNLTDQQAAALKKFQEHLQESDSLLSGHDDRYTLLRFLKARQWDVNKATIMYTHMTKWRHDHHTDQLFETFAFPEADKVLTHYPHFYHKRDRYGRPVYIELLGVSDSAKVLEATSLERLLDYHVVEWERLMRQILPACSALAGRPIITRNVILDLKGASLKTFSAAAQKILRTIAIIDQDYYCECLGQMFILNTPAVFRLAWAVVNPLLEERTRRKIVILGADYLPTLTQLIPLENLPTCLGGTSLIHDTKTSIGPWTEAHLPAAQAPAVEAADKAEQAEHEAEAKQLAGGDAAAGGPVDQHAAPVAVMAVA